MHSPFLSSFSKIFLTAVLLVLAGVAGLLVLLFYTEPTLGPRWLFFFFLTMTGGGIALPFAYFLQRRIATRPVSDGVLIREAIWFAIFVDLAIWLQLGRVLNGMIAIFLAGGLVLLEVLLCLGESAVFKADEISDE